jgi:tetratricopeptide (TPR) repeat protein
MGLALRRLNRTPEAIAAYDGAVAADPENYEAWDNQGYAHVVLGNYPEAHRCIDQSLVVNPKHANGYYNRACCYAAQNDIEPALEALAKALKLNPKKYQPSAAKDPQFNCLKNHPRFLELMRKR